MNVKRPTAVFFSLLFLAAGITGCADKDKKNPADIEVRKMAEFSDRLGQASVKLYIYSGDVEEKNIRAYTEKLGCRMLHAYFYPDTVPLNEIPIEEIRSATSFSEVQEILFHGEGYAGWRFASRCFSVIPIVTDCRESRVSQNCR
jgi:hypothetical protein